MKRLVRSSAVSGTVRAPASKSIAQRVIALAAMANGQSEILNVGSSADCLAAIGVCADLGAKIGGDSELLTVEGGLKLPIAPLNCGESGLGIRMFSAIAATLNGRVTLVGQGTLKNRPMQIVADALTQQGVECSTASGFLPIQVKGPARGGLVRVDGSLSSQVLSGLLVAAPMASADVTILATNLKSSPYVQLTIDAMRSFGVDVESIGNAEFRVKAGQPYRASRYHVEGDWSGAAFMLVAGAIAGTVEVTSLNPRSTQPDRAIVTALMRSGAHIAAGTNSVFAERATLTGFEFDATHCPDLFPPLVALAAHCQGKTRILGANRLKAKESDRAATLTEEFAKLGINIEVQGNLVVIQGGRVKSGRVQSHGDHRVAMACSVAALHGNCEVEVDDAEVVQKSYPDFYADLENLTGNKLTCYI